VEFLPQEPLPAGHPIGSRRFGGKVMTATMEILLVEDNPDDVALTLNAFASHNLSNTIEVVRDGEEALDYLFCKGEYAGREVNDPPRVILLDLRLPKIDGLEVLRRIKADSHTRNIPVVILTTSQEERDVVRGYSLGVNSYIVKPVDFDQFVGAARLLGMYWLLLNTPAPARTRAAKVS
jgi:two-component system response regulator